MAHYFELSTILMSSLAAIYFIFISIKAKSGFRTGFFFMGITILTTMVVHSILSSLSKLEIIEMNLTMNLMTIQLFIGSIFAIWAAYTIHVELREIGKDGHVEKYLERKNSKKINNN